MRDIRSQLEAIGNSGPPVSSSDVISRLKRGRRRRIGTALGIIAIPGAIALGTVFAINTAGTDGEQSVHVADSSATATSSSTALPQPVEVAEGVLVSAIVTPSTLEGVAVTPVETIGVDHVLFTTELEVDNLAGEAIEIVNFGDSAVLGDPPSLAIASPFCGFTEVQNEVARAGVCIARSQRTPIGSGQSSNLTLYATNDLAGLEPLEAGSYEYPLTLTVQRGGAPPTELKFTVVFEITVR